MKLLKTNRKHKSKKAQTATCQTESDLERERMTKSTRKVLKRTNSVRLASGRRLEIRPKIRSKSSTTKVSKSKKENMK